MKRIPTKLLRNYLNNHMISTSLLTLRWESWLMYSVINDTNRRALILDSTAPSHKTITAQQWTAHKEVWVTFICFFVYCFVHMHMYLCLCMHGHVFVYAHTHVSVCMPVHMCINASVCICFHACVCSHAHAISFICSSETTCLSSYRS